MNEQVRERRRIRLWPAVVVLLVLVFIGLALPIYEGRRHQWIAEELKAAGGFADFSHFESVPVSRPPGISSPPFAGTFYENQSTLPAIIEKTGLSLAVRRIRRVVINDPSELPAALQLVRQIGELDDLSFHSCGVTADQLESLLGDVQVKTLNIPEARLPRTGMPWLNIEGLTALHVGRTQFSNAAIDDLPDSLEWLNATRTRINDDGLESFVRRKNLKVLWLRRTPTSEAAIEDLRKKMPWCKIEWEPLKNP